jgi:hypothetical protein
MRALKRQGLPRRSTRHILPARVQRVWRVHAWVFGSADLEALFVWSAMIAGRCKTPLRSVRLAAFAGRHRGDVPWRSGEERAPTGFLTFALEGTDSYADSAEG